MYCMSRYATDIGVRSDVVKVGVKDLAVNWGWTCSDDQEEEDEIQQNYVVRQSPNSVKALASHCEIEVAVP
ncbi:hypothetical protein P8452_47360 [Trifolium repens]|nr:hypothetical protein P8452_47360 [Trifolium repens]